MRFVLFCKDNGIRLTLFPVVFESLVSRARNAAVAHFMTEPDATHLLFIDSDIEFEPQDVLRLLNVNQPVVCAGYAQKWLSEENMREVMKKPQVPSNPLELCTRCSVHLANWNDDPAPVMEGEYATTGFLLIQRGVVDAMMRQYPDRKFTMEIDGYLGAKQEFFYDFFPVHINPSTRRYESEDYGFSRLWREMGGKIHLVTDISLKHHGWFAFPGNFYRQLVYAKETAEASLKV